MSFVLDNNDEEDVDARKDEIIILHEVEGDGEEGHDVEEDHDEEEHDEEEGQNEELHDEVLEHDVGELYEEVNDVLEKDDAQDEEENDV